MTEVWEGDQIQHLNQLKKGSAVHVIGHIRMHRYTGADGTERSTYEVYASAIEPVS